MKTPVLAACFCAISAFAVAAPPKAADWVTPSANIPSSLAQEDNQMAEDRFYECSITKLGTALDRLKDKEFLELTDELAVYYAGHSYRAREGTKAYLVRGAFANYTGQFSLFFKDGELLIQHMSLGRNATPQFCPLIVQLPSPPKKILIRIGGAQ
ncbi:hypothetical protein N9A94_03840 [Akkermansiaceae bacterium]|nr:hypothetical protein [Akkermansiaceae bacterium]